MMTNIQRGFRCKLEEHVDPANEITVEVAVSGQSIYDYCCFGVDTANKLSDDRYMVFYNQTSSPANEIILSQSAAGATYRINLSRIPVSINKLVFTVSIDGNGTMSGVNRCLVNIGQSGNNKLQLDLAGRDFQNEKALIVIEIYRKDVWRLGVVASGFNGGLPDLLKVYGGQETKETKPLSPPKPEPVKQAPVISLQKITLKKGEKISLAKNSNAPLGEILVNLNWNQSGRNPIDLDLGCLFEMKDGVRIGGGLFGLGGSNRGIVQALGNTFGSYDSLPYISLDGDDRTGNSQGGENLRINGKMIAQFKRILIYTFIYEGAVNWREVDGIITIKNPGHPDIIVQMDEYSSSQRMCAIAMLENRDDKMFSIEKIVRFFDGHQLMDQAFAWNLQWVAARK